MAENLSLLAINELLRNNGVDAKNSFAVFKSISSNLNQKKEYLLQEVILRIIEQREQFPEYRSMISDFAREIGLFPYLNPDELSLADKLAYQFHRPDGLLQENIVFHRAQARVYFDILEGKNIILSAPTSFGKSLIIDTIIAKGIFKNIAIVLPTIALIDETRKRLSKFKNNFKIITHSNQVVEQKNIFILTQERVIEILKDVEIDFFVIDEFYKIQPTPTDQERSIVLNQAFYKLLKKGGQFYLLGPNIENINASVFPKNVEIKFIKTDYKTVITEKIKVSVKNSQEQTLLDLCDSLKPEPTLIYCASPNSANKVAKLLINSGKFEKNNTNEGAVNWLRQEYHPDWYLPQALEYGIGIHHGKIPRSISQFAVKAFNEDKLQFLICTSTLIEGVNTKAKNVIIYDNRIARDKFDFFTFNNICGRSGRMFQHFIGRVYLFHLAPEEELPLVDFPLFSQNDDVPEKLLMQMDDEDLTEKSREKVKKYSSNSVLSIKTIKENSNIDPQYQIDLANELEKNALQLNRLLNWHGMPDKNQILRTCELIWDFLVDAKRMGNVTSGKQLSFLINRIRILKSVKGLIQQELADKGEPDKINDSIENILDFVRYWAQYNFPKYLMALDRIQKEIFEKKGLPFGDYGYFANQIECLFTNPLFVPLDEYGIPLQTSDKIKHLLNTSDNFDTLLNSIKYLNTSKLDISDFEKELLLDLKEHI